MSASQGCGKEKAPKGPKQRDACSAALLLARDEEAPVIRALLAVLKAHFEPDGAEDEELGMMMNMVISFRCGYTLRRVERVVNNLNRHWEGALLAQCHKPAKVVVAVNITNR